MHNVKIKKSPLPFHEKCLLIASHAAPREFKASLREHASTVRERQTPASGDTGARIIIISDAFNNLVLGFEDNL